MALALDRLESKRAGIELVAVRAEDGKQRAVVYVPEGQLKHFVTRFEEYATGLTDSGMAKHRDLVERIESLRRATLRELWTDDPSVFPELDKPIWWEVWLRRHDGREVERLSEFATLADMTVGERRLTLDDRIVALLWGTPRQLSESIDVLNDLAELRLAKVSASFFDHAPAVAQAGWVDDLSGRTTLPDADAPTICILDTGITRGHPLLSALVDPAAAMAVDPTWGGHDDGGGPTEAGHGTEMAGLAAYGDLAPVLGSSDPIEMRHRLESVKILPPTGANDPELYGAITAQAIALPEIGFPGKKRVFSMAVTAADKRDNGKPTSWSAAIDALSTGRILDPSNQELRFVTDNDDSETPRRLIVVSAGNAPAQDIDHLRHSDRESVHDPAQAWNALTVGAHTDKVSLADPQYSGWVALAERGELSPYSTTSVGFEPGWPIKPEVVLEGGNVARDPADDLQHGIAGLSLLTTGHRPTQSPLTVSWATSAATAQVARIAAIVHAEYPSLWPETVRALVVHSARWTDSMQARLDGVSQKGRKALLVRRYGYGVPDLGRALRSANDALTLIAQARLRPFNSGKMGEMHVHELPWPKQVLQSLGGTTVRLRLTLSYFVEPNPSRRGHRGRYSYASHSLRFALKAPLEPTDTFRKRINVKALAEAEQKPKAESNASAWVLGEARNVGSVHSDVWEGTGADLAECGVIAVYPVTGWWKHQPKRDRSEFGAPYALVASIETDAEDVDLWTPVATQVNVPVQELTVSW